MPVLEQVLEQYPGKVKMVFKQFPLRSHAFADKAARATIAAHRMGKFWTFHDLLFKHYRQISDQKIDEVRAQVGLDAVRFKQEMDSDHARKRVATDLKIGRQAGVRGTPAIFVNGRLVRNRSVSGIRRAVQDALN